MPIDNNKNAVIIKPSTPTAPLINTIEAFKFQFNNSSQSFFNLLRFEPLILVPIF